MRSFKFKKRYYRDLILLLSEVGAVSKDNKQSYPMHVYINPKDYKQIRLEISKRFYKEFPYFPKKSKTMLSSIAMYLLNYAPTMSDAVKPGYILVNDKGIESESDAVIPGYIVVNDEIIESEKV